MRAFYRDLFRTELVVARRDDPKLGSALGRLAATGEIEAVLPGIYALPGCRERFDARVMALRTYDPDAILMGKAAACLSFWPELDVGEVHAITKHRRAGQKGFRFVRRTLPDDLIGDMGGQRLTVPALTALDLCADLGGAGIDEVLRRGGATLADLWRAMDQIAGQPGNQLRRRFLRESSEEPWSEAERLLHGLLREAGITGWRGNVALIIKGERCVVDVLFRRERLVIEVDGRHFHGAARFDDDRWRQNKLVIAGWRVLRFTWRMLEERPTEVIEMVEEALASQARSPSRFAA